MNNIFRLPAEWEKQSGILLSWPHEDSDWAYMLDEVTKCFISIAEAIVKYETLIIVAPDISKIKKDLSHINSDRIKYYQMPTNDTWARDFGAITVLDKNNNPVICDFKFNGWGLKFASDYDNLITSELMDYNALFGEYKNHLNFVLEGGSVESDGNGTILTTSECLLSKNRNGGSSKTEITGYLKKCFGARQVLWLDYGALEGDDTDSHIDTLARFAPGNIILYTGCDNSGDVHYDNLKLMEKQLSEFRNAEGERYTLIKLPLPDPVFDENEERLPATYANFLIMNNGVLVPVYRQKNNDELALNIIKGVFPGHEVTGIDCNALIKQHGSLHCVTMQFPEHVLKNKK